MNTRARDAFASISRRLNRIDLDDAPLLGWLTPALREAAGSESAMIYTVAAEDGGLEVGNATVAGLGQSISDDLRERFRAVSRGSRELWTFYDPRQVDPRQQNAFFRAGSARKVIEGDLPAALRRRVPSKEVDRRVAMYRHSGIWDVYRLWGVADHDNSRALLCDGARLLAWVGVLHEGRLEPGIEARLRALVPLLRRRLLLEERLSGASENRVLSAVLEELHGAAYVLDGRRRVVAANSAGAKRLAHSREQTTSLRSGDSDPERTWIDLTTRGCPDHVLVIDRPPPDGGSASVDSVARRFSLTPREADVLRQLSAGRTNRAIAVALECAERTVETHVRRILAKTDCASRSELVALIWRTVSPT